MTFLAAHVEVPDDDQQKDTMLAMAEACDCQRMVWDGWPHGGPYSSHDDTKRWAEVHNDANAFAKKNGVLSGLHNHWWEFEGVEGHMPYEEWPTPGQRLT